MNNIFRSIFRISISIIIIILLIFICLFRNEIFQDKNPFLIVIGALKLELFNKEYLIYKENNYITRLNYPLIDILEKNGFKRFDDKWVWNIIENENGEEFIFSINYYFSNYVIYKLTKIN